MKTLSEDKILFQPDLSARLFYQNGDQWVETTNLTGTYLKGEFIFPQSKGSPYNPMVTMVIPDLATAEQAVAVRVVVLGNLYVNDQVTEQKIAAYVDVILNP